VTRKGGRQERSTQGFQASLDRVNVTDKSLACVLRFCPSRDQSPLRAQRRDWHRESLDGGLIQGWLLTAGSAPPGFEIALLKVAEDVLRQDPRLRDTNRRTVLIMRSLDIEDGSLPSRLPLTDHREHHRARGMDATVGVASRLARNEFAG
jgi:hypothetical protein